MGMNVGRCFGAGSGRKPFGYTRFWPLLTIFSLQLVVVHSSLNRPTDVEESHAKRCVLVLLPFAGERTLL